jgi:hypothetical protein
MWSQATGFAIPEKLTKQETEWQTHVQPKLQDDLKKIGDKDIDILEGKEKYNREAPKEDVEKLKLLKGHVKKGQFVTKFRKVFNKDEMSDDLEFVRAKVGDKDDDIEYFSILPTSPP